MYKGAYALVILVAGIMAMNVVRATPADGDQGSTTTPDGSNESIFQPPEDSDISQIKDTHPPWVKEDLRQTINDFAKNTSEELQSLDRVKKIYDVKVESSDTRAIFFKQVNKRLLDLGHPAPAAVANIVSKAGALFDYLSMDIFFRAVSILTSEFFLGRGMEVDRSLSQKYANAVESALESIGNTDDPKAILHAALDGYHTFLVPFGFKPLEEVLDELYELFASELIILHDSV